MNQPREQARDELRRFAKGGKHNLSQSIFRMACFNVREHVRGKRATMRRSFEETVAWAVEWVRRSDPGFKPQYA